MKFDRPFLIDSLHLFVLCGFAIAQPLYDLLGHNATFFVAHRAGPGVILVLVLALSVGLPVFLVLVQASVGCLGASLRRWFHLVLVATFIALIALAVFNRWAELPHYAILGGVVAVGIASTVSYERFQQVRTFMTVL